VTTSAEALAPSRLRRGATRSGARILVDAAFSALLFMGTIVGVIALASLIWTIVDHGWARLVADPAAFLSSYVSRLPARAGIKAALVGSAYLMALTALFCFPVGVGAAIYLEEFAPGTGSPTSWRPTSPTWPGSRRWSTAYWDWGSSPASCAWGRACWPAPSPWP
jgi:hypothetical protein